MLLPILSTALFKRLRKSIGCSFDSANLTSYGLIFFGTPHGGPGPNWKVVFGKTCVKIVQSIPGKTSNDIMEALQKGSLFSDTLQNQWRHQLKHYQIVTFYEGRGDVRAISLA